jgi:hypothetical protein
LPESRTLKLEPDEWQRRPSTRGWRPKQRSSSRHHLHHAVAAVNFTTADSTATSSPPPQREPLRVLLLTLLTTQRGGRATASRHAGRCAVRRAQLAVQPMSGLRAAVFLQNPVSVPPPCTPARVGRPQTTTSPEPVPLRHDRASSCWVPARVHASALAPLWSASVWVPVCAPRSSPP